MDFQGRRTIDHGGNDSSMRSIDGLSDADDGRDRLDAEELMSAAMAASSRSLSTTSSVSSQRRNRPPHLPPPRASLGEAPQRVGITKNTWKILGASLLAISAISVGVVTFEVVESGNLSNISMTIARGNQEVRLQNTDVMQSHRIQHTGPSAKYAGTGVPSFYDDNFEDFAGDSNKKTVPVHWRIPGSKQDLLTHVIGACLGLIQGVDQVGGNGTEIKTSSAGDYVMIDMAVKPSSLDQKKIEVLSSQSLHYLTEFLAGLGVKGKLFILFSDPLERMLTFYYSAQDPASTSFDPALESVSLHEFATWPEDRPEFNFVTKSLLTQGNGLIASDQITVEDFELAKEIILSKAMILLVDDKLGSWAKVATWMKWNEDKKARKCVDSVLLVDWPKVNHPAFEKDSNTSKALVQRNQWDLQLFEFAVQLYQQQTTALVQ
jgi:hypothetical protein